MILFLLYKFLGGDLIWFAMGGMMAILFSSPALLIRNPFVRICAYLLLGFVGILVAHWFYEQFYAWYVTPLGPPLQLNIGPQG